MQKHLAFPKLKGLALVKNETRGHRSHKTKYHHLSLEKSGRTVNLILICSLRLTINNE